MELIDNEAQARSTTQQRLKILGDDEIDELYARPRFTSDERTQFFSLSQLEKDLLQELRSVNSQVLFVLQLGYFKAKHLFFSFDFDEVEDDAKYVCEQHFNARDFDGLSALEKRTRLRQQRLILELFNYRNCNDEEREKLKTKAQQSAVVSGKPIYKLDQPRTQVVPRTRGNRFFAGGRQIEDSCDTAPERRAYA